MHTLAPFDGAVLSYACPCGVKVAKVSAAGAMPPTARGAPTLRWESCKSRPSLPLRSCPCPRCCAYGGRHRERNDVHTPGRGAQQPITCESRAWPCLAERGWQLRCNKHNEATCYPTSIARYVHEHRKLLLDWRAGAHLHSRRLTSPMHPRRTRRRLLGKVQPRNRRVISGEETIVGTGLLISPSSRPAPRACYTL